MTTSKLIDNNRRAHAAKVLAASSRKSQAHEEETTTPLKVTRINKKNKSAIKSLNDQYAVIREDVLKLREDLAVGYDLLKDYVETRVNLRTMIRAK